MALSGKCEIQPHSTRNDDFLGSAAKPCDINFLTLLRFYYIRPRHAERMIPGYYNHIA